MPAGRAATGAKTAGDIHSGILIAQVQNFYADILGHFANVLHGFAYPRAGLLVSATGLGDILGNLVDNLFELMIFFHD